MKDTVVCLDINKNEVEVATSELSWRPSVYGLLIEDNKILLSRQWDGYDFPGGGVNLDETLAEACVREFQEETGLNVEVGDPIYCTSTFFAPHQAARYADKYWNCPVIIFRVKKLGGELSTTGFDEDEKVYAEMAAWVDLKEIEQIKFISSVFNSVAIIHKAI